MGAEKSVVPGAALADRLDLDPDWVPDDPEVLEWNEDVFGDSGRGCGGCGRDPEGIDDPAEAMDLAGGPPDGGPSETDMQPEWGSE